jgi:hypothetical protein
MQQSNLAPLSNILFAAMSNDTGMRRGVNKEFDFILHEMFKV